MAFATGNDGAIAMRAGVSAKHDCLVIGLQHSVVLQIANGAAASNGFSKPLSRSNRDVAFCLSTVDIRGREHLM